MSTILIVGSLLNTFYLFTCIKLYRLHRQSDPVSSPNARFVSAQLDVEPLERPSLVSRFRSGVWSTFDYSWRFLFGMQLSTSPRDVPGKLSRLQQLEVWTPGELEIVLFTVYSPAHALLWMATGSSNWVLMLIIMSVVGIQVISCIDYFLGPNFYLVECNDVCVSNFIEGQGNHRRRSDE